MEAGEPVVVRDAEEGLANGRAAITESLALVMTCDETMILAHFHQMHSANVFLVGY